MVEFVFVWSIKEIIKVSLFAYLLIAILIFTFLLIAIEDMNDILEESLSILKWGLLVIAPATIAVSATITFLARFVFWVLTIW